MTHLDTTVAVIMVISLIVGVLSAFSKRTAPVVVRDVSFGVFFITITIAIFRTHASPFVGFTCVMVAFILFGHVFFAIRGKRKAKRSQTDIVKSV